jgi:hypothetical protein
MSSHPLGHPAKLRLVVAVLLALLVAVPTARAFDARTGDQMTVRADEVIDDDLYVAGQAVVIDGTVNGDVFVAGQIIVVNGTINGGLLAAGQTVIVNGTVRDTARIGAQAAQIGGEARIGRDLMIGAYSLENRPGSVIGRDLALGAYQALLAGTVERNVRGGMAGLDIRGLVGGDVDITVGSTEEGAPGPTTMSPPPEIALPSVRPGLTVEDSAQINGRLKYTSAREFAPRGSVGQGVTWEQQRVEERAQPGPMSTVADIVRKLAALAIVGILLVWLAPRWTKRLADTVQAKPFPSIGWGLVASVAAIAAMIGICVGTMLLAGALFATTLAGLGALVAVLGMLAEATLIVGFVSFTALIGQAIIAYMGGAWALQRTNPSWATHPAAPLLAGIPILVLLTAIPILGGVIGLIAALAALGALWLWVRELRAPTPAAVVVDQGPTALAA